MFSMTTTKRTSDAVVGDEETERKRDNRQKDRGAPGQVCADGVT